MKRTGHLQLPLKQLFTLLFLSFFTAVLLAQPTGIWEKADVKERMTDVEANKKRNPSFVFSAKADDRGMNFEMSSVWSNDRKTHTYRGQVAWEWTCQKGPSMLIPGELVTIKGIISNLSAEPSGNVCASARFGNWYFMKPQSGKTGDECARPNAGAVMIGSFTVPRQPSLKRDGTFNNFLYLTFSLTGGNESRFIERTIIYKWKASQDPAQQAPEKPVINPPADQSTAPQAYTEKSVYKVGEPIVVKFKNLPGFATDWVGIYGAKAYHANEYIEWKYTNGLKEGSMEFKTPRYGPGEYVFRIYENNGYKLLVQTVAFSVIQQRGEKQEVRSEKES